MSGVPAAVCSCPDTLFGLFLEDLHHHLQASAPDTGTNIQHMWLTSMEYAHDIFFLAHCPSHLQALNTALANYCQELHMACIASQHRKDKSYDDW